MAWELAQGRKHSLRQKSTLDRGTSEAFGYQFHEGHWALRDGRDFTGYAWQFSTDGRGQGLTNVHHLESGQMSSPPGAVGTVS